MIASDQIISKIENGFKYMNARPQLFIQPNIRNILTKIVNKTAITYEEARDVLDWYASKPDIPTDILDQLTGKEPGRAWLKAGAKKAPPKFTPEQLTKELTKKILDLDKKEPVIIKRQVVSSGSSGSDGWSPVLAGVEYNGGVYLQVVDWVGGNGRKPDSGEYVGPTGLVEFIDDATNIKGDSGGGGGDTFQNLFFQESVGTPTIPLNADTDNYFLLYQNTGLIGGDAVFKQFIWIP